MPYLGHQCDCQILAFLPSRVQTRSALLTFRKSGLIDGQDGAATYILTVVQPEHNESTLSRDQGLRERALQKL